MDKTTEHWSITAERELAELDDKIAKQYTPYTYYNRQRQYYWPEGLESRDTGTIERYDAGRVDAERGDVIISAVDDHDAQRVAIGWLLRGHVDDLTEILDNGVMIRAVAAWL